MHVRRTPGEDWAPFSQGEDKELDEKRREKEPEGPKIQRRKILNAAAAEIAHENAQENRPKKRHYSTILRNTSTSFGSKVFPAISCMIFLASSLV